MWRWESASDLLEGTRWQNHSDMFPKVSPGPPHELSVGPVPVSPVKDTHYWNYIHYFFYLWCFLLNKFIFVFLLFFSLQLTLEYSRFDDCTVAYIDCKLCPVHMYLDTGSNPGWSVIHSTSSFFISSSWTFVSLQQTHSLARGICIQWPQLHLHIGLVKYFCFIFFFQMHNGQYWNYICNENKYL